MTHVCSSGGETARYVLNALVVAASVQSEIGCFCHPFSRCRLHCTTVRVRMAFHLRCTVLQGFFQQSLRDMRYTAVVMLWSPVYTEVEQLETQLVHQIIRRAVLTYISACRAALLPRLAARAMLVVVNCSLTISE